ncbi:spore coat protein YsxE [Bacillus sp. HMF5848]|uniref:spore coat protein YsxE n=1 Tax=Bacillus sp. HMF5848 TaxID=2495421 RepID=UPI000F79A164|nr:spore coat protein YsxE [Bacillus sp. HMF5848]RSK28038.1 spore coat protein YsxE [Bacillus sp. HMF5848]
MLTSVLRGYNITPEYVEAYGRAQKVVSRNGTYALKQTSLEHARKLENIFTYLREKGFNHYVPVHRAANNEYVLEQKDTAYYLMPWYANNANEERNEKHLTMFRVLSDLHRKTMEEISVTDEEITKQFEQYTEKWNKRKEELEEIIDSFERNIYMSPFQLNACFFYNNTISAIDYALQKMETWQEEVTKDKKARLVLTHGNLSIQHFVYDDLKNARLLNFERSYFAAPIHDLVPYFYKALRGYPTQCEDCITWLYQYQQDSPLQPAELALFQCYLATPNHMYRHLIEYAKPKQNISELNAVTKLQKIYWQQKNIEYVCTRIDQIEEEKQQQNTQTTSS